GLLLKRLATARSSAQHPRNSKDSNVHAIAIRTANVNILNAPSTGSPFGIMRLPSEWDHRERRHAVPRWWRDHRRVCEPPALIVYVKPLGALRWTLAISFRSGFA